MSPYGRNRSGSYRVDLRRVPWRYFAAIFALAVWVSAAIDVLASRMVAAPLQSEDNLIQNPGFEEGSDGQVAHWAYYGDVTWTDQDVHSGNRAMRVAAQNGSSSLQSPWFQAPAHARIEIGAWLRGENILPGNESHHRMRLTLNAFAEDRETRLQHWDLVTREGTFEWRYFQSSFIVPPGVAYLRLSIQLTESSGAFWVDDVSARVVQTLPAIEEIGLGAPVIIPQPWQMQATGATLPLTRTHIVIAEHNALLEQHLRALFQQLELETTFLRPSEVGNLGETASPTDTIIWLGDNQHIPLDQHFRARFPHIEWTELDVQGYYLSVTQQQQQTLIYIGANSEMGRFYGLQTLRQLIDPAQRTVAVADIADRPSIIRRGAPIGVQWFREQNVLFDRMAGLKMNFVWIQGSFLNGKFWHQWREPLNERERAELAHFVNEANRHFIVPHIAIAPRGPNPDAYTTYSSDTEIDLVVQKMLALHELGVRHFGLAFDDLINFGQEVLFGEDVAVFDNNIGAAHVYFSTQVYNRLTTVHPDIVFTIVPMKYEALSHSDEADEAYLRALAALPAEIGLYSAIEQTSEAQAVLELTGRRHMVWDNFWSSFYQNEAAPQTVIPLQRPADLNHNLITAYSFSPLIPILQDGYMISWRTAADYAWAPERYHAWASFQLAAAQHVNRGAQGDPTLWAAPPVISPDSGIYSPPLSISMGYEQEPVEGMEIRYTVDGTFPTLQSEIYTQPFLVPDGAHMRVRARVFQNGIAVSERSQSFYEVSAAGDMPPGQEPDPDPTPEPDDTIGEQPGGPLQRFLTPPLLALIGAVALLLLGIAGGIAYWWSRRRTYFKNAALDLCTPVVATDR